MPSVFLCSPTNSTMFTTCCQCAICDDQRCCPKCGIEIDQQGHRSRWEHAYGKQKRAHEAAVKNARKESL